MKEYYCPLCKKPTKRPGNQFWPFCSERCKLIDLGKWAAGEYSIPGEEHEGKIEEEAGEKKLQ